MGVVRVEMAIGDDAEEIRAAVLGLAGVSLVQMRRHAFPPLYTSGIRYQVDPPGQQRFQTAQETLGRMHGDCEDLAAYLCAEYWRHGERGATIQVRRMSPRMFHILVRRANGQVEDPSKRLGM